MVFHPHAFLCHTPPFVPGAKIKRPPGALKNTPVLALQTSSENRVARNVE